MRWGAQAGRENDRPGLFQGCFSPPFACHRQYRPLPVTVHFQLSPTPAKPMKTPSVPCISLETALSLSLVICADPVATILSWTRLPPGSSNLREGCATWLSSLPACSNSRLQSASPPGYGGSWADGPVTDLPSSCFPHTHTFPPTLPAHCPIMWSH